MTTSHETVSDLSRIEAPWSKEILLQQVEYEGGVRMLRLRIREGKRFTILDLDPKSAATLGRSLADWSSPIAGPDRG
jgi:hypothetical protein